MLLADIAKEKPNKQSFICNVYTNIVDFKEIKTIYKC